MGVSRTNISAVIVCGLPATYCDLIGSISSTQGWTVDDDPFTVPVPVSQAHILYQDNDVYGFSAPTDLRPVLNLLNLDEKVKTSFRAIKLLLGCKISRASSTWFV